MSRIQIKLTMFVLLTVFMSNKIMGQYYSRIYAPENGLRSHIWQIKLYENEVIASVDEVNSDYSDLVTFIKKIDQNGTIIASKEYKGYQGFYNLLELRNDTIFIAGIEYNESDSTIYWKWAMMKINGDKIAEYKYKVIHLSHIGTTGLGYNTPSPYGITLVKNNELILWGEGLDNRMQNINQDGVRIPFRSVFMRVGLDGEQKGDLFWFEKSDSPARRMHDACTDIDGNMVFSYEWGDRFAEDPEEYGKRSIFKVMPDNSIDSISTIISTNLNRGYPKIAVDSEGNYFINPVYYGGAAPGTNTNLRDVSFITKINRFGEVLWTSMIPPIWRESIYVGTQTQKINRISTTRNGDVLCSGTVAILDSFEIEGYDKKMFATSILCSFIARFSSDGKLLWRHFIAPQRKVYDMRIRGNTIVDIKEAPDGSIITGGRLERYEDKVTGVFDAWLMRLSPEGCLDDSCTHVGKYWVFPGEIVSSSEEVNLSTATKLTLYPNPSSGYIHVQLPQDVVLPVQYQISAKDGSVRELGTQSSEEFRLECGHLTQGMYIISVRDKHGKVSVGKWVKQ